MKLCRYGKDGSERPGIVDAQGKLRDLSKVIGALDADALSPRNLARIAKIKPETLAVVTGSPRFGVPFTGISKVRRHRFELFRPCSRGRHGSTDRADHFHEGHHVHLRAE